jgi:16S rRNA processing protein RimM
MALPLPEGSHYVHQIIGLRVFTTEGRDLGEISEVIQSPASDVYVTAQAMIPALRQVVKQIDLEGKRMIVSLPAEEEEER